MFHPTQQPLKKANSHQTGVNHLFLIGSLGRTAPLCRSEGHFTHSVLTTATAAVTAAVTEGGTTPWGIFASHIAVLQSITFQVCATFTHRLLQRSTTCGKSPMLPKQATIKMRKFAAAIQPHAPCLSICRTSADVTHDRISLTSFWRIV